MGKKDKTDNANSRGNSINGRARKAERRETAFARAEATKHISVRQKLERINSQNPTGAKRQRARYEALIAKQVDKGQEVAKQARKKEQKAEAVA
jgi:hypothetical protein